MMSQIRWFSLFVMQKKVFIERRSKAICVELFHDETFIKPIDRTVSFPHLTAPSHWAISSQHFVMWF